MKLNKKRTSSSNISLKDEYKSKSPRAIAFAIRKLMKQRKSLSADSDIKALLDQYILEYENKKDIKARLIDNA